MGESSSLGPWCRLKVLGRGGFGLVTLWRNQITDEHIGELKSEIDFSINSVFSD